MGETPAGNVIYLSTFSKILAPGIRLAWAIAPTAVVTKLVQAKQGVDLHTATLNQMVAYEVSRDGFLDQHIQLIRSTYQDRRDLMIAALNMEAPREISWFHPEGGLFLWITLPKGLDASLLLKQAVSKKVAFVPGAPFHPKGGGENTLRLNFSNAKPDKIKAGIQRLGEVFYKAMKTPLSV
jgi:2-aminoadipate transaminase